MTADDLESLWIGAFRYYLGRETYAVDEFAKLLIREWGNIPDNAQNVIRRDLSEAITRDNRMREEGLKNGLPLGMDCDRQSWTNVMKSIRAKV